MAKFKPLGLWLCSLGLGLLLLGFDFHEVIAAPKNITIEWLTFEVPEAEQALFIEKEYEIWEPLDRRSPDYLGKEMWQDNQNPDRLTMINRWASADHHADITKEMSQQAEQDFNAAVGKEYPIVEAKKFYLRH